MRNAIAVTILCTKLSLLTGCAALGVSASSDPVTKLNDADRLIWDQGRPFPAEKLIFEAMEIYQNQKDSRGIARAYRDYGALLQSGAVIKHEKIYRENGFRDKSVTFDNRDVKSKEYFTKALESYQAAEKQLRDTEKFDELANLYFNMAWTSNRLGDKQNTCAFYDKSLAANNENIRHNPTAKPRFSLGYSSPADEVAALKKRAGCE